VFGLPNRRSAHIFLELGWKKVGTVPAVDVPPEGRRRLAARSARGRAGSRAGSCPLGVRKGRAARAKLVGARGRAGSRRARSSVPAEVEALSKEVERAVRAHGPARRAWLDWRFLGAPRASIARSRSVDESGGSPPTRGAAPAPGESLGWLVDILARDDDALASAISAGLERLELAGATVVRAPRGRRLLVERPPPGGGVPAARASQPPDRDRVGERARSTPWRRPRSTRAAGT
jgi:hypothetical protein